MTGLVFNSVFTNKMSMSLLLMYLVEVDEVGVEDRDVVLGLVADLPQLSDDLGLLAGVADVVALQDEPAAHDVLSTLLKHKNISIESDWFSWIM